MFYEDFEDLIFTEDIVLKARIKITWVLYY